MAVYDASWARPAPSLLKPGDGIILYCSRTLTKTPTIAQCDAYRTQGVQVGFVFEDSADRAAVQGFAAGVSDGALALTQARSKGHPRGWTVYFACDVVSPLNLEYARGFRDGLTSYYQPGLYAGDRNLERARVGVGYKQLWQASAASWSDHWGPNHHGTYQYAALWQSTLASPVAGTDLNIVNRAGWNHPLIGTPEDTLEGDDMTTEEHDALMAIAASLDALRNDQAHDNTLHGVRKNDDENTATVLARLDALPALDATAVVNRSLAGVGFAGSVAQILAGINKAVGEAAPAAAVDVAALATALADDLGPDLGIELVAALKAAL
jgi:hypothetical protein